MAAKTPEAFQNVKTRLLSLPEVEIVTGLSKPTIYRHIQKSLFPAPLKISTRRVGWLSDDIDSWLSSLQRSN